MNTPAQAHELYKKMVDMKGKFTIEFFNLNKYEVSHSALGHHHWDNEKGHGEAEFTTKHGKMKFNFNQVKRIK